jgi:hypothetical protein
MLTVSPGQLHVGARLAAELLACPNHAGFAAPAAFVFAHVVSSSEEAQQDRCRAGPKSRSRSCAFRLSVSARNPRERRPFLGARGTESAAFSVRSQYRFPDLTEVVR